MSVRLEMHHDARRSVRRRRHHVRRLSRLLAGLLSSLFASLAAAQILVPATAALPTGGQVVVGAGRITQSGSQMVINQSTARLGLDWQRFDIGSQSSVEFRQPDAHSIALNRVVGNDASAIYGRLSANGQVFLTNPNGVLFAPGAKVDVGGLVASTLDLSQQDFADGRLVFRDVGGAGALRNQGRLSAGSGGYLALFGNRVANDGQMTVNAGSVVLASGRAATVSISGSGLLSAVVTPGLAGSVENNGLIAADGGSVTLTARSAEAIASSLVNNKGVIRANSLVERDGEIWITGDRVANSGQITADAAGMLAAGRIVVQGDLVHGRADIAGTLSARSEQGGGGHIETSAADVRIAHGTRVDTRGAAGHGGTWLIDPTDFTVSAGGAAQDASGIGADTLVANLANNNITLQTTNGSGADPGDVNVNAAVSWSASTTLTLQAYHDVNVNASITASGNTAGLVLTPNVGAGGGTFHLNKTNGTQPQITLSGTSPTLQIAGNNYTVVKDLNALQAIDGNAGALSGNYALGVDIDASASATSNGGLGFNPIADEVNNSTSFSGRFNGLGHTISALNINRPASNFTGLFATTFNASVQNVSLANSTISGSSYVGGLIGYARGSTGIANVTSSGAVAAVDDSSSGLYLGGIVGRFSGASGASISKATVSGMVSGSSNTSHSIGGVVGSVDAGSLADVASSANVSADDRSSGTGGSYTGGVVGAFSGTGIARASSTGAVNGKYDTGGIAGYASFSGTLDSSTSSGNVGGTQYVGGLVGNAAGSGGIVNGNSSARVTATGNASYAGGLVGFQQAAGGVSNGQATGAVAGGSTVGGLVGQTAYAVSGSQASGSVTGGNGNIGGLVGYSSGGGIASSQASGPVSGTGYVGGLAGQVYGGSVTGSTASGSVTAVGGGTSYGGGLIGLYGNYYYDAGHQISDSSASGTVYVDAGNSSAGGLVGYVQYGGIANSSSTSAVTAIDGAHPGTVYSSGMYAGGLVGYFSSASDITGSTASGKVVSAYYGGGLVGLFSAGGISGSSASGSVTSLAHAGGLVGVFSSGTSIVNSSASGQVSAGSGYSAGGLVGYVSSGTQAFSNISASGDVTVGGSGYIGGLIGQYYGAGITNGFASGNVSNPGGSAYTGGLIGYAYTGYSSGSAINDSAATGNVNGGSSTGGLIGYYNNPNGLGGISNSSASGTVASTGSSAYYVGGLVGYLSSYGGGSSTFDVRNSHASGNVSGPQAVGGLIGYYSGSSGVSGSYATGNVGQIDTNLYYSSLTGGLVGYYYNSAGAARGGISGSYATGDVSTSTQSYYDSYTGGLVGQLTASGSVLSLSNSYATGNVLATRSGTYINYGTNYGGGLVGSAGTAVDRTYATGSVTLVGGSSRKAGGLVGNASNVAAITNSFWDTESSGLASSSGGTGASSAQMKLASTFTNWSIASTAGAGTVWRVYDGMTRPLLSSFLTPLALSLSDASKTYDGTTSFGDAVLSGVGHPELIFVNGASPNVGSSGVSASNVYSVQNGYDLSVAGSSTLTVTPRPVTLAGVIADKTYDGTRTANLATGAHPDGLVAGEDLAFDSTGFSAVFADKNAGVNKTVTITGLALADGQVGKASNYSLSNASSSAASIGKAPLTVGGLAATDRTYDGTTTVAVTATPNGSVSGKVAGDDVTADISGVTSGTVTSKNVGNAKPVTVSGATLTGADRANYSIAGIGGVTVNITPLGVTENNLSATSRQYDASVNVYVSNANAVLNGTLAGDNVMLVANQYLNGTVADKNAETGKAVSVSGLALRGLDAANYSVNAGPLTVDITPYQTYLYVYDASHVSRTYDGTNAASLGVTFSKYYNDNVTLTTGAATYADKNVAYDGSGVVTYKPITVSGASLSGPDSGNYALAIDSVTYSYGQIQPKSLTVTGVAASNKVYDGNRNIVVNVGSAGVDSNGVVPGDIVAISVPGNGQITGTTADKNVGTGKAVTVPGLTLTGRDAPNYTITGSNGVTASITKKDVTATYTGVDRVYNGNQYVNVLASTGDFVGNDDVHFWSNYQTNNYGSNLFCYWSCASFTDTGAKNVGSGKPVTVSSDSLYGNDAGNYNFNGYSGATTTASVTPKAITPVFSGVDKVYDGTVNATVSLNAGASGIIYGDSLSSTQTAVFTGANAKNVGSAKSISVSNAAPSGTDAANYTFSASTGSASASITPKAVTLSGISAADRVYDGTVNVTVSANGTVGSSGFIANDDVGVRLPDGGLTSGTMASKSVGTAKPVTVTGLSLIGLDSGNYQIDPAGSGITVNIAQKPLTAAYAGVNRTYNGGITAQVTGSSTDVIDTDTVNFSQTAVFSGVDARAAGTHKSINVTGITLGGTDALNYALQNTTASTFADVSAKPITVVYLGNNRVYDGVTDTSATVIGNSPELVAGDLVTFSQSAAFRGDGAAGNGKLIDVSNITLGGLQSANYSLTANTAVASANITRRPIGVTGITASNRIYDGTATVAINVAGAVIDTSGVISGDSVNVTVPPNGISTGTVVDSSGNADKNVGTGKPVQVTGLGITGGSALNYALTGASGLTVNIAPKSVSATYSSPSKVYDGSVAAQVNASSSDFIASDIGAVGIGANGSFSAGKNVGTGLTVQVSGGYLTGVERNNYSLSNPSGSAIADITAKALTPTYSGGTKAYDGSAVAPVSSTTAGIVTGDRLSFSQTAVFGGSIAKNVAFDGGGNVTSKPITVSGITLGGADALNYSLTTTVASTSGTITPKGITVAGLTSVTANDRSYDGTRTVIVTIPVNVTLVANSADIVSGDDVTIFVPPAGDTTGTMADKNVGQHKAVVITGLGLSGNDAGNYTVVGTAGVTANITPLALNASYSGVNKVYDGTTSASVVGTSSDVIGSDLVGIAGSGVFTGNGARNVGTDKTVQFSGVTLSGADARNYALQNSSGTTTASITPKTLVPSYTGGTRVYDGSTDAPVTASTAGVISGDVVTFSETAAFTGSGAKSAGSNKPVSVTGIALSGTDAGNYLLAGNSTAATATITRRPITLIGLNGISAVDRVYNGGTQVSVDVSTSGTPTPSPGDLITGDDIAVNVPVNGSTTGTMADKNVGTNKPLLSIQGLGLSGVDKDNYSLASGSGVTVSITPKTLTSVWTGVNKVYDGTAAATVNGSSSDVVVGDLVAIAGSGVFTGSGAKNVGTGKAISVSSGSLSGNDGANYTLSNPSGSATADITPRPVGVSFVGGTRVYDGSGAAPVIASTSALVEGDDVAVAQTAVFTGIGAKNVGNSKPVSVSDISLTGTDATNYALTTNAYATTASVTPKALTIIGLTGITATDRTYDGTPTVAVNVQSSGTGGLNSADIVTGDIVSVTSLVAGQTTGTMADKNVGSNKPVVVTGLELTGADAGNYKIAGTDGVTVNITPKSLTATYTGVNKVYDGTALATLSNSSADVVPGDKISITATGVFTGTDAKNVGTGKAIAVSGGGLTGADAPNYDLANPTGSASADITPRPLSATFTGGTRVYDGTVAAPVTASLDGAIDGDKLTLSETAVFTGSGARNVGDAKPVQISGIALSGADAGNYALNVGTPSTTASITPKPITVDGITGVQATDRVYDGTTVVAVTVNNSGGTVAPNSSDIITGDDVSIGGVINGQTTGTMLDKNVGTSKPVSIAGLTLTGADAANYSVGAIGGVRVSISPLILPVTGLAAVDRTYDGTVTVSLNTSLAGLSGVLGSDDVQLSTSGATGTMADKNVGSQKAVTVSSLTLAGADAGNYGVASAGGLSVNITPKTLTAAYSGDKKVYDGTAAALVTGSSADIVDKDVVTIAAVGNFTGSDAENAGTGKPIAVSGGTLSGGDASNYSLANPTGSASADVTPRKVSVAANIVVRAADDSTPSELGFSTNPGGLVNGDQIKSVHLDVPQESIGAAGLSFFDITPSGAVFERGNPSNYELNYQSGKLIVLPSTSAQSQGGGTPQLVAFLDADTQALAERAPQALERASAVINQPGTSTPGTPGRRLNTVSRVVALPLPPEDPASSSGQITLPALQRAPLISFDPSMRRLISGKE